MIAIIDYGLGNLGSISNMLKVIGEKNRITSDVATISEADKLILPGVGAFDAGMERLQELKLTELIRDAADQGKPILGICLGMQLLGQRSEEGQREGLALIPFENIRFRLDSKIGFKIPHMGWDVVEYRQECPLTAGIGDRQRYYFVHSYHAVCNDSQNVLMTCEYGYEFAAAVRKGNIYGVQFHPEKSHNFGMALLRNFAKEC